MDSLPSQILQSTIGCNHLLREFLFWRSVRGRRESKHAQYVLRLLTFARFVFHALCLFSFFNICGESGQRDFRADYMLAFLNDLGLGHICYDISRLLCVVESQL